MSNDDKAFKLIEAITELEGVVSSEVYRKSTGENVYDVLVKTENGRLVEQTLSNRSDLELLEKYIALVVSAGDSNIRSYPNIDSEQNEQN